MIRILPIVLLTACSGLGFQTTDTRIDGASDFFDPDSAGARMCTDTAGGVFATWSDDRDGPAGVFFNRSLDGGLTWLDEPRRISVGADDATAPQITCNDGDVHIVWEDRGDGVLGHPNTYIDSSLDGGETWSGNLLLERDLNGRFVSMAPRVVAAGDYVHVVWMGNLYGAFDVFAVSSADRGCTFTDPTVVNSSDRGSAWSGDPVVDADDLGEVWVVWEDARNGESDIYVARSTDGGESFNDDRRIDRGDDAGLTASHGVQLDFVGDTVTVVWHDQREGEGWSVFANQRIEGNGWSDEAFKLDGGDGASDAMSPQLIMVDRTAHVVWHDERLGTFKVRYNTLTDGIVGTEQELSGGTSGAHGLYPRITAGDGTLLVAWEDTRNDLSAYNNDLYYDFSTDGGATWLAEDLRINSGHGGRTIAADIDVVVSGGEVLATWTDNRAATLDIYFNRLTLGLAADTPEGVTE